MRTLTKVMLLAVCFLCTSSSVAFAATATDAELLDPTFIFRGLLSLGMAGLAWYGKKVIDKVEALERELGRLQALVLRMETQEQLARALHQEDTQLQTQINLLREQMLRDYHTKEDTREHHQNMEKLLNSVREEIHRLCVKVETLQERFYERRGQGPDRHQ